MAVVYRKTKIHCPQCSYEGGAKYVGSRFGWWLVWMVLFMLSFEMYPFFILSIPLMMWLMFKPATQICPKCSYPNPLSLKTYRLNNKAVPDNVIDLDKKRKQKVA